MSINLCNTIFGVTVSSSTVSTEGYEIGNLLHNGKQHIGKGFMAERFIKAPIDIIFSFPFKIEIKEIYLDPSVGNQASCGFEIFTAFLQDGKQTEQCNFQSIGKSPWSNNSKFSLYHFVNYRYNKKVDLGHHNLDEHHWTHKTSIQLSLSLRHQFSQFLIQVTHVKVKITRTHGGSIPCLRRLEIHGQPSYACSQVDVNGFLDKVHSLHSQNDPGPSSISKNKSEIPKLEKADSSLGSSGFPDEPLIPEEFEDPLTIDLMSLPVILPSGHTVDQTTLDKYTAAEAEWGRPPSDPFTGLTFTHTSKPIPNLLLKSRVDNYILKAGKKFQYLARTTIGVTNHGLLDPKTLDRFPGRIQNNSHIMQNQAHNSQKSKIDPRKISKSDSVVHNMPNSKLKGFFRNSKLYDSTVPNLKRKTGVSAMMSDRTNVKRIAEDCQHHEDLVRDSLTDALDATLTQLPSFQEVHCHAESTRQSSPQQATLSVSCNLCGNCPSDFEDGSPKHLYQFPCHHIYCRSCLLKSVSDSDGGQYTCSTCDLKVDSKDIIRIHTIT